MVIYFLLPAAALAGYLCGRIHQCKLDGGGGFTARVERQRKTVTPFSERAHINFPSRTYLRERLQVVRGNKRWPT